MQSMKLINSINMPRWIKRQKERKRKSIGNFYTLLKIVSPRLFLSSFHFPFFSPSFFLFFFFLISKKTAREYFNPHFPMQLRMANTLLKFQLNRAAAVPTA